MANPRYSPLNRLDNEMATEKRTVWSLWSREWV